jgi:hypothetical protein
LASQAVAILRELHPLTESSGYKFPDASTNTRLMSEDAIDASLRWLGYSRDDLCGHGFRATARTIHNEVPGVRPDFI